MQFFDTTPLGRILNRFSKDMYMVDGVIPTSMEQFMVASFIVVMTVIVITYSVPIFGTMIIPLGIVYVIIQVCVCLKLCACLSLYLFCVCEGHLFC